MSAIKALDLLYDYCFQLRDGKRFNSYGSRQYERKTPVSPSIIMKDNHTKEMTGPGQQTKSQVLRWMRDKEAEWARAGRINRFGTLTGGPKAVRDLAWVQGCFPHLNETEQVFVLDCINGQVVAPPKICYAGPGFGGTT